MKVGRPGSAAASSTELIGGSHPAWPGWDRVLTRANIAPWAWPAGMCVLVILANLASLSGVVDVNPLNWVSGLGPTFRHGVLPGAYSIDPQIGFTAQTLGHRVALDWLGGKVPWWNPFEGVGEPLAPGVIAAAFFPLVMLQALPSGLLFFHVILECIAALATYGLVREMTCSRPIAAAGGVAFALIGTFAWFGNAVVNPLCFLPLTVLGVERSFRHPYENRGWIVLAAGVALSIVSGFPEVAYLDGILAAVWTALRLVQSRRGAVLAYLWRVVAGWATGLLLCAPLLLAFLGYLHHGNVGPHASAYANLFMPPRYGVTHFGLPYITGPLTPTGSFRPGSSPNFAFSNGLQGGYVTATLMVMALIGLALAGRRELLLRLVLAVFVFLSIGRDLHLPVIFHLVGMVPGVQASLFPRYIMADIEFVTVILACIGLASLRSPRLPRLGILAVGAVVVVWSVVVAHLVQPQLAVFDHLNSYQRPYTDGSLAWAIALAAIVSLVALLRPRRLATGLVVGLMLVDSLALFVVPELAAPLTQKLDLRPVAFLRAHLHGQRFANLGPIMPNYGTYFGLDEVDVNDIPEATRYTNFITQHLAPNESPLRYTGLYVLNAKGPTPAQEIAQHLSSYEAIGVRYVVAYAGTNPLAGVPGVRQAFDDGFIAIYSLPHPAPLFSTASSACSVHRQGFGQALVRCPASTHLTWRELFFPGWSATVNGKAAPIAHAGPLFQSVALPAGSSVVRFSYAPPELDLGIAGTLLGAGVLAAGPLATLAWRRRHRVQERRRTAALASPA
jgi:hypothetical protein